MERSSLHRSIVKSQFHIAARTVDYTQLQGLLKKGQWKEADQETLNVMLKAADRISENWLNSESIKNFPCTDLRTIDQLWIKYSKGRFGFSVQKKIWQEVNGNYGAFGDRVGWRVFKKVKVLRERGVVIQKNEDGRRSGSRSKTMGW